MKSNSEFNELHYLHNMTKVKPLKTFRFQVILQIMQYTKGHEILPYYHYLKNLNIFKLGLIRWHKDDCTPHLIPEDCNKQLMQTKYIQQISEFIHSNYALCIQVVSVSTKQKLFEIKEIFFIHDRFLIISDHVSETCRALMCSTDGCYGNR